MNNLLRWLPVIVIVIMIHFLSAIPDLHLVNDEEIPLWYQEYIAKYTVTIGQSGFFSYSLSIHPDFIVHKLGHIGAFGVLGVSLYYAAGRSVYRAVVLTALMACIDEFHQYFVHGRCCRFGDVVLDTMSGLLFILVIRTNCKKKKYFGIF